MSDMLREMDHGPSALPAGSKLTLFNSSTNVEIMARVKARNRHVNGLTWGLHTSIGPEAVAGPCCSAGGRFHHCDFIAR